MDNIQQPQAEEERRRQEEDEARERSHAASAYADYYSRRDRDRIHFGHGQRDFAVDGRPLMVPTAAGPIPYETYCKPQRDK